MTQKQKNELITQFIEFVNGIAEDDSGTPVTAEPEPEKVELLTVKECTELIPKLSANTVRELAKQGKIESIRAGKGERGKILIFKRSLLNLQN